MTSLEQKADVMAASNVALQVSEKLWYIICKTFFVVQQQPVALLLAIQLMQSSV